MRSHEDQGWWHEYNSGRGAIPEATVGAEEFMKALLIGASAAKPRIASDNLDRKRRQVSSGLFRVEARRGRPF